MKKRFIFPTIFFLVVCMASAWADEPTAGTAKTPHAVIVERDLTFDPVVDGSTVTHDYLVKNTGEGELEISQVKTG